MADETGKNKGEKDLENLSLEERIKLLEEENKKLKEKLENKKNIEDYNERELEHQKKMSKALKDTAEAFGNLTEANKHNVDLLKMQALLQLDQMGITKEARAEQAKALEDLIKYGDTSKIAYTENNKELKQIIDKLEKESEIKRGIEILDKTRISVHKDIAKAMGLRVKAQDTMLGQLGALGTLMSKNKEMQADILAGLNEQIKEAFHYKTIAASVFDKVYRNSMKLFEDFDRAQASIAKATGQGREFNDVLYEVGRAGNLFGVSMDEAADAISTMVAQTSAFTNLNKDLQAEIALNVAQMNELGIATSDSAEIFQNFNQSLGITASESIKMQKELAMAGVEVGIGASKITKDFNASLSTLMVYGRESINVFKGIAAAAKAAGVETSTLLNIAQKYDTFAGAAEGVGKLNSLLGTQLSTTEMLMATEDERIRMLVESVQAQGIAFQDMDRHTQKAVANAAGITNMAEANKIFGMSLKEYDENERKLKASAEAQKKFEEAITATIPVTEQLKKLGTELLITMKPVFEKIAAGAKFLTETLQDMSTESKEFFGTVVAGISAIALVAPIFMVGGGLLAGLAAMPVSIAASGAAAMGASVGFGALAASLAPIFKGILAVAAVGGLAYGLSSMFSGGEESNKGLTQAELGAVQNLDNIMNADFSSALSTIKAIVGEASKLGSDMKVTSTIENLAMITSGQAKDISGNIVTASTTNVVAKVNNMFDGMKVNLIIDGYQAEGVFAGAQDSIENQ